jgi:hypothetical protein
MAKKRARDESAVDTAEAARREKQREKQREAIAAKAAGKKFVNPEKRPKRKPAIARRVEKKKEKYRVEHAASRRAVQKEIKRQKAAAPDVVIVPIFWKGEAKQMARVLSACADVEAALADSGRKVLLDGGHKYTPGQKFAHWEHKGVVLRVEVGPREAERGCCTVARSFKPGEPAIRTQRVAIEAQGLGAELERLTALENPAGEEAEEGEQADAAEAIGEGVLAGADAGVGGRRGGDDLDDDFADESDEEEEENADAPSGSADDVLVLGGAPPAAQPPAKAKAPKKGGKAEGSAEQRRAKKVRTVSF